MRESGFGLGWRFLKLLLYVLWIHSVLSFVLGIQYKVLLNSVDARSFPVVCSSVSFHNAAEETAYLFLQYSVTLGQCFLWSRKRQVCFVCRFWSPWEHVPLNLMSSEWLFLIQRDFCNFLTVTLLLDWCSNFSSNCWFGFLHTFHWWLVSFYYHLSFCSKVFELVILLRYFFPSVFPILLHTNALFM